MALLRCLTGAGWQVRALYRTRTGRNPPPLPGVEWLPGDLEDQTALNTLVAGTDAVIHCAGVVRGANRSDFDPVNAAGAGQVARAAANQERVPRFLLISSLAARMPQLSHYAASKWRGECEVRGALENRRWTVLRPPAVYGLGDRELLPLFRCIAKGYAPLPAGRNRRFSLIHVDDLALAVLRWLEVDACYGQTFELDDGHPGGYSWDTVLSLAGLALRQSAEVRRVPIPVPLLYLVAWVNLASSRLFGYAPMLTPGKMREIMHPDWVCDNHAITLATGWRPNLGLEIGLARAYGGGFPE
ncbi:MAG: NAD-dependent epimerase/dehydratase family protein [Betaproteobacteria bacterium]|nr:NAD-dependent epimerase/dehydratase family protein [Betaproteobacteria bacterium]